MASTLGFLSTVRVAVRGVVRQIARLAARPATRRISDERALEIGNGVRRLVYCLSCVAALTANPVSAAELPDNFDHMPADLQTALLDFLSPDQTRLWGEHAKQSGTHSLVRYLDDFHTQVEVDFRRGVIQVETRDEQRQQSAPRQQLRQALVSILLTPADPRLIDLYTAADFGLTGEPFLLGQVKDHEGKDIATQWRAQRFADHLIKTRLQTTSQGYRVQLSMVRQHKTVAAGYYAHHVTEAANRYQVAPSLIYAIMETESSFNPFAVSPVGAFGLMQVMPKTAGRDVMEKIYQRSHTPSRDYLMDVANNIDAGTAYLSILRDNYLRDIRDPAVREFCVIAAYNGGAGLLFKAFHRDRKTAIERINRLSAKKVYRHIIKRHPKEETRNYLKKVTERMKKYANVG